MFPVKSALAIVSAGVLIATAVPANAASAPKPKVGQCFNYTKADMDRVSPAKKASVKCTKTHNIEVYRVATFVYSGSPYTLSESDLYSIATEACQPWTGNDNTEFNYWLYFFPTKAQWKAGQRWIRCDAAIVTADSTNDLLTFTKWKTKKLDIR